MSDTPRSDSAEEKVNQHSAAQWGLGGWKMARTLERELTAKSAEVERLRAVVDAALAWSGVEPSTSVLTREIDRFLAAQEAK